MELKKYLRNWELIDFSPSSYRIQVIEGDIKFDKLMSWAVKEQLHVLVNPFFNQAKELIKGTIIEDIKSFKERESIQAGLILLFIIENGDGTFTHLYRDFDEGITLLLTRNCKDEDCNCMGCQMYEAQVVLYGKDGIDMRRTNGDTVALNLSDSSLLMEPEFFGGIEAEWSEWEKKVGF